jgi:hypothetical protein
MLNCLTAVLYDDECVVLKTGNYRNGPVACRIGRQLNRIDICVVVFAVKWN